jgi:hypothetical protein
MVNFARKERRNRKIQNLKISFCAEEISLAEEIRVGHPKNRLASFFLSFLSFFLSFFLQIKVRQLLYVFKREMVEDAMDADKGEQTTLGAAGTATSNATKRKIEVKKWNAVAVWSWSTSFDSCAICRNTLHEPSIEFQANSQQEARDGLSIAVRFTSMRAYVALVLLSFALSRILSAFSNAFVFA